MSTTVETRIGRVVWHDLLTGDIEKEKGFYTELLGWEVEVFEPGEMDYPMISANGTQHGGFGEAPPGAPPHWLAYVRVDDVDAVAERVQQNGGQVHHGPDDIPEVGRFAIFADPQGAVIAAHALKVKESDAPPAEGVFAWDELLTTDVEQAKAFYGAVFGWTTADMDMGEMGTYTLFKRADDQAAGGLMQKPAEDPSPPHWMTYLATPDVDATVEKARGLGAKIYMEGMDIPDVGRIAVIADPTGAVVGLFQAQG